MGKFYSYVSGTSLVTLVHQKLHELGLVELAIDYHVLPLLNVDARSGN